MKLIGLTGNIASGKSTVAALLVQLGAAHLDADRLVHDLYQSGTKVTTEVAAHFGQEVLAADGSINRRALGAIVFGNPQALRALEQIVHPQIGPAMAERIRGMITQPNPPPAMVIEAVKLIETGRYKMVNQVWFVIASEEVQTERMMKQRGLSAAEAKARLQSQPAIAERLRFADLIIENNGSLEKLAQQVKAGWQRLFS